MATAHQIRELITETTTGTVRPRVPREVREEVFEDPFTFRIDRYPNRHLGFGIGEHFCLGANLARRSQRALWLELSRRLDWAELTGEPEQIHSAFVVGLKKLPMRYRIKPAA